MFSRKSLFLVFALFAATLSAGCRYEQCIISPHVLKSDPFEAEICLSPEKSSYSVGDQIRIIYRLKNVSSSPVAFNRSATLIKTLIRSEHALPGYFKRHYSQGSRLFETETGINIGTIKTITVRDFEIVAPGEAITREWKMTLWIHGKVWIRSFMDVQLPEYQPYVPETINGESILRLSKKRIPFPNAWEGTIEDERTIHVCESQEVKERLNKAFPLLFTITSFSEIDKKDRNEVLDLLFVHPVHGADLIEKNYWKLPDVNKVHLVYHLIENLSKHGSVYLATGLVNVFLKQKGQSETHDALVGRLSKALKSGTHVGESKYGYRLKKEIYNQLMNGGEKK